MRRVRTRSVERVVATPGVYLRSGNLALCVADAVLRSDIRRQQMLDHGRCQLGRLKPFTRKG